MPYTLTELAGDVRAILSQSEASACSDDLCKLVSKALNDPEFTSTHLTDRRDGEGPREVLFEDDELGFCICGHVYGDQAIGKPHDHGSSWALYGQAEGTTEMTDWKIVRKGDGDDPSIVEPNKVYTFDSDEFGRRGTFRQCPFAETYRADQTRQNRRCKPRSYEALKDCCPFLILMARSIGRRWPVTVNIT